MKKYYWLMLMMTLGFSQCAVAQCTGGTSAGSITPTSVYQTVNVPIGDFYYTFVVPASCFPTYDFSYCTADGSNATFDTQITVLDNTGTAVSGGYNDDFCSTQSHVTWTPTAGGTYRVHVNLYSCAATTVAATLAYKMTVPANMVYSSSTVVQSSTATTTKCDFDQDVVCLQVVTTGVCSPLTLTSIQLAAGSSTSALLLDVSKIHVYYTGTNNAFSPTNEFVSGGTTPAGGTNTLSGSQVLASGTNYFWVSYDINTAATTSNLVDASITQFTLAATNRTPTATNPAGTRTVNVCSTTYPSTKALGLQHWVKSDVGVTGSPVSAWGDQSSGTSTTGTMAQATAASRPSVVANGVNFQTYIRFDGVDDGLSSTNTFAGTTLYNATNNTIFMVKNLKSGTVDYKWETTATGATRIGFELNGSAPRFDFVDDAGGRNNLSATAITNKDILICGITDATNNTLKLNGNIEAVKNHGGLTFAPAPATVRPLTFGGDGTINPAFSNVDIAEVLTFNVKLGSSELRRVESYLALKYGITLGNNRSTGSEVIYLSSDGTSIWSNKTGYHNHVIGIGRDNAAANSGLNKLRSKSVTSLNANADILTIANGTSMGGTAFGTDKSFLVIGNNGRTLPATAASKADVPPITIQTRLNRVWQAQETGTVGTVSLKFDLASVVGVAGVAGANNLADVRLLVDGNGVFASGATIISPTGFNNTVDTVVFQVDFTALTGYYFTVGSVNKLTAPLPVTLTKFTAVCNQNEVDINWTTKSEHNSEDFILERSDDMEKWVKAGELAGAGNSNYNSNYHLTDFNRHDGTSYYRLVQRDFDGKTETFGPVSVTCIPEEDNLSIYPNPAESNFYVALNLNRQIEDLQIEIIDINGKTVLSNYLNAVEGSNLSVFNTDKLQAGTYFVKVISKELNISPKKLVIL